MIVTFFRSSSFNTFDFCPMQYFLGYSLGLPNPSMTVKADAGNIVHKALELLGSKKLAIQNNQDSFINQEIGKSWKVSEFDEEIAYKEAWELYTTKLATNWDWKVKHKKYHEICHDWMLDCLQLNNGMWNPMNRDIIQPEQYFDFVIEKDWAKYNYIMPDGKKEVGYLGLKGTVDLITKIDDNTIEYLDWKTGGTRKNWATGKEKNWKELRDDPQLRIYHYALSRLYPQYEHIVMTIIYIQAGGAFSLDFSRDDLPKTEEILKRQFVKVRDCQRPYRIMGTFDGWKCKRLCHQGMNNYVDKQGRDTGKLICDHFQSEIITLGMDKVYNKYGTKDGNKYGSGGGVAKRE